MNWNTILNTLKIIFALGPEALSFIEALLAAINNAPGTPEHTAALAKLQTLSTPAATVTK